METEKERIENYAQKVKEGERAINYIYGAIGDEGPPEDVIGIVEDVIPQENECPKIKFLGISYLKSGVPIGVPEVRTMESVSTMKVMFFRLPARLIKYWPMLLVAWIFTRKSLYALLYDYIDELHGVTVRKENMYGSARNFYAQEITRAFKEAIKGEKEIIRKILDKFIDLVVFIFEWDYPYRYPVQDVLSLVQRTENPVEELNRLLDIATERYQNEYIGLHEKIAVVKKAVRVLRYLPAFKRILRNFFNELDPEKVEISEDDWYFCLNKHHYNFRGLTYKERMAIKEKLDKERGHIKVNFRAFSPPEYEEWIARQKQLYGVS